jgi:lipooligosaccharide transport system permease protein
MTLAGCLVPPPPPPGFMAGVWNVVSRNLRVWRNYASASAVGNFGEPLLYLVALGYGLGRVVPTLGGMSYAEFIAPGLVVSTVMYTATFEGTFGAYTRLTTQKTFDAILSTPVTPRELVAGEVTWGGIKAALGASSVLLVIWLFGLVPSWQALGLVPLGLLAGLMFTSLAMIVTAISRSYEFFNYYFTLIVAPMFLFSGIFFPLEQMPGWVEQSAQFLPLTHVVELSRALVRGTLNARHLTHFAVMVLVGVVAYSICSTLLARKLRV